MRNIEEMSLEEVEKLILGDIEEPALSDFDRIYGTMYAHLVEEYRVPWVQDAWRVDSGINRAYEDFRVAREHLCERFGLDWEDADLERIMNAVLVLEKDVGRRMFDAGVEYAKRGFQL